MVIFDFQLVLRAALIEIRDIAAISEGVEFYAMLADNALIESQSVYNLKEVTLN